MTLKKTPRCLECEVEISPLTKTGLCKSHGKKVRRQILLAAFQPNECSNVSCFYLEAYGRKGMCHNCYMDIYRGRNPRTQVKSYGPASYTQMHTRLARHVGKASTYKCVDCQGQAQHWSWVGACDEVQTNGTLYWCRHEEHYAPRCVPDHKRYDNALNAE